LEEIHLTVKSLMLHFEIDVEPTDLATNDVLAQEV
jgi:hypothetical protein